MKTILLTANVDTSRIDKINVSAYIAERQQKIDEIFSDIKDIEINTLLIPNYNNEVRLISSSQNIVELKIFVYYVYVGGLSPKEACEKLILAESESKKWIKNSTDNIKIIIVENYEGHSELVEIYNSEKNYTYKL